MYEMGLTIVGGLIAAGAGALTTILTYWLARKAERSALEREALVAWVSAYEEWVALYNDYSGLVLGKPPDPAAEWKTVYLKRLDEVLKAGRELDVAKFRVLVVERREWVRSAVRRLTKQSEVRSLISTGDERAMAQAFRSEADRLRANLDAFLTRLATAG